MSTIEQLQQQLASVQQQQQQQQQQFQTTMNQAAAEIQQLRTLVQAAQASSSSSSSPSALPPSNQGAATQIRIDMKAMQPSSFLGNANTDPEQWLLEMERYFDISGWGEDHPRRVPLASTYLKDIASRWFTSASKSEELGPHPSWSTFKERLTARFRPFAASRLARAALRNLRHRHKVAGYTQEFQKQMQVIDDMSVTDQIETYLNGLQQHIAQEVDREQPTTLSAAMEAAQRIELMLSVRRGPAAFGPSMSRGRFPSYRRQDTHPSTNMGADQNDRMDLSAAYVNHSSDRAPTEQTEQQRTAEEEMDEHHQQVYSMRGGRGGSLRPFRGGSGRGGSSSSRGPRLSPEELERLYKEGRCFHCKDTGHAARFCDKKSKNY
jgi:hypothetical protein